MGKREEDRIMSGIKRVTTHDFFDWGDDGNPRVRGVVFDGEIFDSQSFRDKGYTIGSTASSVINRGYIPILPPLATEKTGVVLLCKNISKEQRTIGDVLAFASKNGWKVPSVEFSLRVRMKIPNKAICWMGVKSIVCMHNPIGETPASKTTLCLLQFNSGQLSMLPDVDVLYLAQNPKLEEVSESDGFLFVE